MAVVVLAAACKPKRQIVVAPPPVQTEVPADHSKEETLQKLTANQLKFNTLTLKAKANLDINGDANDVTMNFRIKDKEKIWVSITAVGGAVEVARALITPDSIKILNRLKSEYVNKPFSYIYNFTNKQVNFNTLQAVLTGNAVDDFLTESADLKNSNGVWLLSGHKEDLDYQLTFNTLLKVSETNLNDVKAGQALKINYDNYQKLNEYLFPGRLNINTLSNNKKINIHLDFTKVDGNTPLEFPFTIPKRFKAIE